VVVRDAFHRIATEQSGCCAPERRALTVSTSPNFAAKWLVHRLGRFAEAHPEIDLRVSASLHHVDSRARISILPFATATVTAAGLHVTRLCTEELFPVCSPKLLAGRNRPPHARGSRALRAAACERSPRVAAVARLCGVTAVDHRAAPFSIRQAWRSTPRSMDRA